MIIEMLMNVIFNVFDFLTSLIDIPSLPEQLHDVVNTAAQAIAMGVGILANYTTYDYLLVLFGIFIAVDAGILLYHFVMWILKKIPFLGVQ